MQATNVSSRSNITRTGMTITLSEMVSGNVWAMVMKLAKIFSMICPAIILTARRMQRLICFVKNDITSIGTTNGHMNGLTVLGAKSLKNLNPCS